MDIETKLKWLNFNSWYGLYPRMKIINAGNCIVCGQEIKIAATRGNNKFPNIFICPRCKRRVYKEKKPAEKEE